MSPVVDVVAESPLWDAEPTSEDVARRAVDAALGEIVRTYNKSAEMSVILADDARLKDLNRDWRGKDQPTNVLSFPAAEGEDIATAPLLGDLVIAFETVAEEARRDGKSFNDHFAHLVVHGTLHLFGFDHMSDAEAEIMENTERAALARLGISDPYLETGPR
jgi:probable rRNA maturation factor